MTRHFVSTREVCQRLASLGDAPASEYLDTFYVARDAAENVDTFETATLAGIEVAAKAVFVHVPLNALLSRVRREIGRVESNYLVNKIVDFCVGEHLRNDPVGTLHIVVDAVLEISSPATEYFANTVGRSMNDNFAITACLRDDVLGRLNARDYAALIGVGANFAAVDVAQRDYYLTQRVRAHATIDLTPRAVETALAIAPEWQGTLNELVETAQALAQQETLVPA
jgi:hypothetical protein